MELSRSEVKFIPNIFLISVPILMLFYYSSCFISDNARLPLVQDSSDYAKESADLHQSISRVRAALLMEADCIEIKTEFYHLKEVLTKTCSTDEAESLVDEIYVAYKNGNRLLAINLLNQLFTKSNKNH